MGRRERGCAHKLPLNYAELLFHFTLLNSWVVSYAIHSLRCYSLPVPLQSFNKFWFIKIPLRKLAMSKSLSLNVGWLRLLSSIVFDAFWLIAVGSSDGQRTSLFAFIKSSANCCWWAWIPRLFNQLKAYGVDEKAKRFLSKKINKSRKLSEVLQGFELDLLRLHSLWLKLHWVWGLQRLWTNLIVRLFI